jgi:hypothetical protein
MTRDSKLPPESENADDGQGGFLSRWSRRKAAAREEKPLEAPADPAAEPAAAGEAEAEIDPASLPPIESLTESSDFSIFLKKGVPPALRAAALRKLWLVEPSVVNYEPLVEYNWDFTAPGYGEMLPTDDIAKYVKNVFEGSLPKTPASESVSPTPGSPAPGSPGSEQEAGHEPQRLAQAPAEEQLAEVPDIGQDASSEPAAVYTPPRRRHGGALPG